MEEIPKSKLIVFFDDLLVHSLDLQTNLNTMEEVFMLLCDALTWKRLI